jgi:hypothetical protein
MAMTHDPITEAVQAVSAFLVSDMSLGETLHRIAALGRDAIGPAEAVGITLLDERDQPTTAVFTDDLPPVIDQSQYRGGTGPCLDAYRTQGTVRVDDTSAVADRWPDFSRTAVAHGVFSTLSLPLAATDDCFGAFNLYASARHGFNERDTSNAGVFGTQAAVVLANARAYWVAFDLASTLRESIDTRSIIDRAIATIMATKGCGEGEAFKALVRRADEEGRPLAEMARRMVDQRQGGRRNGA